MSKEQDSMVKALRAIVVPKLRERGFKGSFPHLRRRTQDQVDLLTFQFDRHGGGFVIEIAKCPADGYTTHWDEHIPPDKVTAWDMPPAARRRIQPGRGPHSNPSDWFRYDWPSRSDESFAQAAQDVLPYLEEAEQWWAGEM